MAKRILLTLGFASLFLVVFGVSAQADVVYDHWSPLNVAETITDLGGGLYEYAYAFENTDVEGIWLFLVYPNFTIVDSSAETFDEKPAWLASDIPVGIVWPPYDARNLDPGILAVASTQGPDSPYSPDPVAVGQAVSGFSFTADVYDPSPKYYVYELQSNYTGDSGFVSAVGLTSTDCPGMVGTWTIHGEWEKWTEEFTFFADGTFANTAGGSGAWWQDGCNVEWLVLSYPNAHYSGFISIDGDVMTGEIETLDGQSGTWNGNRKVCTGCPSMKGFWEFQYFWDRTSGLVAFHADGTFDTSQGEYGAWDQDDCSVDFFFPSGTDYWGVMHPDGQYMSGEMLSPFGNTGIWDAVPYLGCTDWDEDGYAVEGDPCGPFDCDDGDDDIYPGADEVCNGLDDDCDEAVPADEADDDMDGWMICEDDCDDADASINPGVVESKDVGNCADGVDNDCDGLADTDPECQGCFLGIVM